MSGNLLNTPPMCEYLRDLMYFTISLLIIFNMVDQLSLISLTTPLHIHMASPI